jgi:hypothetical protein
MQIELISIKNYFPGNPGEKEPLYVQYSFLNKKVNSHKIQWDSISDGKA